MKNKLLKKIFIATSLVLLLSVVVCFLVIYGITYFSTKDTIDQVSDVYTPKIQEAENIAQVEDALHSNESVVFMGVISSDGKLISSNSTIFDVGIQISNSDFTYSVYEKGRVNKLGKIFRGGETMLVSYVSVKNDNLDPNGYVIAVYGIDMNFNDNYFWLAVTGCIVGWLLIAAITYAIFANYVKDEVVPLEKIQIMLENINKGNYNVVSYEAKYKEINDIIDNINKAAKTVSKSLNDLRYEQTKSDFILENVAQGIIALSESDNILICNDVIVNIFDTKENVAGVPLDYLIKDEKILSSVKEAVRQKKDGNIGEIAVGAKFYRIDCKIVNDEIFEPYKDIKYFLLFTDITVEANIAKMRGEFFANASHELKTPLTAIMGYSELLKDGKLSPKNREKCAGEIYENSSSMLSLINKMLTLSKLDTSKIVAETENVNLRELCDGVIAKLKVLASENDITLSCDGEACVMADKGQIYTIVSNLVSNAIKYNKKGGYVKIQLWSDDKTVSLSVEDNGIGISEENRSRVFERFFKVDAARTRTANQSTGLGLAIVKHLVTENNGEIKLESELGVGTKITITFTR